MAALEEAVIEPPAGTTEAEVSPELVAQAGTVKQASQSGAPLCEE